MRYSFIHTAVGTKEKQEISIHVCDEIDSSSTYMYLTSLVPYLST